MKKQDSTAKAVTIPYHTIRTISSPEDLEEGRKVYAGHAPAGAVLELPTDENVRDYLVDAEGKKTKRKTQVHRAIRTTLDNAPNNFSILNGGLVLVARECEIDEKNRLLRLVRPSIINGSQTQGVLRDYFADMQKAGQEPPSIHVTFELLVTDDDGLIAEVSIARNYQNDVMTISIAGRLGQLDELEARLQARDPNSALRKKETERGDDYLDTEKLIQVLTALAPAALGVPTDRAYAYNQRTKCLKQFQKVHDAARKNPDSSEAKLYRFYLDIAPDAWDLYKRWKTHEKWSGTALRSIVREGRKIVEVPDGIVFPIIAAMSEFCVEGKDGWKIQPPANFEDEELIKAAKSTYMEVANSKPHLMGKSRACYSNLRQITSIYRRLSGN